MASVYRASNTRFRDVLGASAAFFIFNFLSCCISSADTLFLKSGKTVHGTIRDRDPKSIRIDVGLGTPVTYAADDVERVETDQKAGKDASASSSSTANESDNPDQLEVQGLDLIDQGQADRGVALLRKAVKLDPKANRHLNLGAILYGNGVALFKEGKKDVAKALFAESEGELKKAIDLFDSNTEAVFLSQAYDLLGEMYAQALGDPQQAREYYQKSIALYQNPSAERGLKALSP